MARCDSYPQGECTTGVCRLASWVGDWWGDAKDWIGTANRRGLQVTMNPTVGAVVVYGPGGNYSDLGHVAVVERRYSDTSFEVEEMNFARWDAYDARNSSMAEVWGFILPPGVYPGQGGFGPALGPRNNAEALAIHWGDFQQLWNSEIDRIVDQKWGLVARIRAVRDR